MAIFAELELEQIIQIDDKTRLSAVETYVSKDEAAITKVEIRPTATAAFVDVTGSSEKDWFLDWNYQGGITRTEEISVQVTTDGVPVVYSKDIDIISETDDLLFSTDSDLKVHEPLIMNWVIDGRNTFLDIHRRSQDLIIDFLDRNGYRKRDWTKVKKADLFDLEEVRDWSVYWALSLITYGRGNATGDIFREKAVEYKAHADRARERVYRSYDFNNNGIEDPSETSIRTNQIKVERT